MKFFSTGLRSANGVFSSNLPVKTLDQKKIEKISNKISKRQRDVKKPGPVTVVVYKK